MKNIYSQKVSKLLKQATEYGNSIPLAQNMPGVADFCDNNNDKTDKQVQKMYGVDGTKILSQQDKLMRKNDNEQDNADNN